MALLFDHRMVNSLAKRSWRIGKTKQHQRHQLQGEQLVIRKKMQYMPARFMIVELMQARERHFVSWSVALQTQRLWPARIIGNMRDGARHKVGHGLGRKELFVQRSEERRVGKGWRAG